MSKLRQLQEKRAALYAEILDQRNQFDGKEMDAEARAAWEKKVNDCNDLDAQIEAEKRFLEIEAREAKAAQQQERNQVDTQAEARAFAKYLIGAEMSAEERSLIKRSINGTAGHVLVPSSIAAKIEKALAGYNGMLQAVDLIRTSTGGDLILPTINDTTKRAQVVAEYGQSTTAGLQFGSVTLKAHTYRTEIIPVSVELLQDAAFDVESFIADLLADRFAAGLNYDLTKGTGENAPKGITLDAKAVNLAGAGIIYDDIVNLRKAVKAKYITGASYMMSTATECDIMLLKGADDRPLWMPSMRDDAPATILGKPVVINDDMDANTIIFGDLKTYKARIARDFSVSVLKEALMEYLAVGVMGFGRADGKLVNAGTDPVAILK